MCSKELERLRRGLIRQRLILRSILQQSTVTLVGYVKEIATHIFSFAGTGTTDQIAYQDHYDSGRGSSYHSSEYSELKNQFFSGIIISSFIASGIYSF